MGDPYAEEEDAEDDGWMYDGEDDGMGGEGARYDKGGESVDAYGNEECCNDEREECGSFVMVDSEVTDDGIRKEDEVEVAGAAAYFGLYGPSSRAASIP